MVKISCHLQMIGAFNYGQLLLRPIPLLVTQSVVANPDQTEARRTKKRKLEVATPFLPTPYLRFWIRHWRAYFPFGCCLFRILNFSIFLLACFKEVKFLFIFSLYSQPGVTFEKFKEKKMKAFDKDKNKKFNKKELEKILNSP